MKDNKNISKKIGIHLILFLFCFCCLSLKANIDFTEIKRNLQILELLTQKEFEKSIRLFHHSKSYSIVNKKKVAETHKLIGSAHFYLDNFDSAFYYYQESLQLANNLGRNDSLIISLLMNLGLSKLRMGHYDEALEYYNQAIEQIESMDFICFPNVYTQLGSLLIKLNKTDSAKHCIMKSISVAYQDTGANNRLLINSLLTLANLYMNNGEYNNSINLEKQAIYLITNISYFDIRKWYIANYNLALSLSSKHNYNAALNIFLDCYDTLRLYPDKINQDPDLFSNIAICYKNLDRLDSAQKFYLLAIKMANNKQVMARAFQNYGNFLLTHRSIYTLAKEYYDSSRAILTEIYGNYHPKLSKVYSSLASYYQIDNNYDTSLKYYQKALKSIDTNLTISNLNSVISEDISPDVLLMKNLKGKIDVIYALFKHSRQNGKPIRLANSLVHNVHEFNKIYAELLYDKILFSDKLQQLIIDIKSINLKGIEASKYLFDLSNDNQYFFDALQFSESSKSLILKSVFVDQINASSCKNDFMSESMIEREIDGINTQINLLQKSKRSDIFYDSILNMQSQVFELIKRKDSIKSINKSNLFNSPFFLAKPEDYLNNFYENNPDRFTVIEYFIQDSLIHIMTLNGKQSGWKRIPVDSTFHTTILKILDFLEYFGDSKQTIATSEFIIESRKIYKLLFDSINITKDEIIIIPDGILTYLPFDVLLTSDVNQFGGYKLLPYLIKSKKISYSYSLDFINAPIENFRITNRPVITILPDYHNPDRKGNEKIQFTSLKEREKELQQLNKILPNIQQYKQLPKNLDLLDEYFGLTMPRISV
ncbi:MAG: tetratricopeptide repeat protein [Bacteroidales bacterium]|nr:tetratricopeptide repeat protein [Bacteroidales bacterium]